VAGFREKRGGAATRVRRWLDGLTGGGVEHDRVAWRAWIVRRWRLDTRDQAALTQRGNDVAWNSGDGAVGFGLVLSGGL
jgi:hypothetical protein